MGGSSYREREAGACERRPVVGQSQNLDPQGSYAMSGWSTRVTGLDRDAVDAPFFVVEDRLGPNHSGGGVDREDIVPVGVTICNQSEI